MDEIKNSEENVNKLLQSKTNIDENKEILNTNGKNETIKNKSIYDYQPSKSDIFKPIAFKNYF